MECGVRGGGGGLVGEGVGGGDAQWGERGRNEVVEGKGEDRRGEGGRRERARWGAGGRLRGKKEWARRERGG